MPAIHFHIFPRTETLLQQYNVEHNIQSTIVNGPQLFDWARHRYRDEMRSDYQIQTEKINAQFEEHASRIVVID